MKQHQPSPAQAKAQKQPEQPGLQHVMHPQPITLETESISHHKPPQLLAYKAAGKLQGKFALITGGDSGIGRSVAVLFAKEGAHIAILYLEKEQQDANETKRIIEEEEGKTCLMFKGDVGEEDTCRQICHQLATTFGRIDILVNNAGEVIWPLESFG